MDATEPSYVATTIFKDRASFNAWMVDRKGTPLANLKRTPETVFYEGTLVISSGTFTGQSDGINSDSARKIHSLLPLRVPFQPMVHRRRLQAWLLFALHMA
jgi:hypothetical protein